MWSKEDNKIKKAKEDILGCFLQTGLMIFKMKVDSLGFSNINYILKMSRKERWK